MRLANTAIVMATYFKDACSKKKYRLLLLNAYDEEESEVVNPASVFR